MASFVGVFDLAMAEALLGPAAADLVSTLAERSLLVRPAAGLGGPRARALPDAGDAARLCRRTGRPRGGAGDPAVHARCVADAAARAAAAYTGPDERAAGATLDRLSRDATAALAWAVEDADPPLAAGLVASLRQWAYLGLRNEVLALAFDVLALGPAAATASVHAAAAEWFWRVGRNQEARAHGEAALAAAGPGSHEELLARDALGDVAMAAGNHEEAAALLRPALDAALRDGRWRDASFAATGVALATTYAGRPADEALAQSRVAAERSGNPSALAFSWFAQGEALADRDTVDRCATAVEHWLASGNESLFVTCLRNLAPLLDRFGASRALVELLAAAVGVGQARGTDEAGRALIAELRALA